MPLDMLEKYLDGAESDTMTFATEEALGRFLASQTGIT